MTITIDRDYQRLAQKLLRASATPELAERFARRTKLRIPPGQTAPERLQHFAEELLAPPNEENS